MAYPTGMLSLTLEDADRRIAALKTRAQSWIATMAAGSVTSTHILVNVGVQLIQEKTALQAAAAKPGIGDYAKAQKNNAGLDVVAEFNALITAITNGIDWISANFPTANDGGTQYLAAQTLQASGPVDRTFSPAQTAGLRTVLQTIVDAIS